MCNYIIIILIHYRLELLPSTATPPKGCTMTTVGSQCEVHMQLQGLVDATKEISRLEDAILKKTSQREKLISTTQIEGYEQKVRGCGLYV